MLLCRDLVPLKGKPPVEFLRPYFTHTTGDTLEEVDKTYKGSVIGKRQRPVGNSKADIKTLAAEALAWLQEQKYSNPMLSLLESAAEYITLGMRGSITNENAEKELLSKDKAIEGLVKTLMRAGKSREQALKLATASFESDEE